MKTKFPVKKVGYADGTTIFLFAIVANLAAQVLISIIAAVGAVATADENFANGGYFQLVCMIVLQLAFCLVPLIYYGRKKALPELLAPVRKPKPSLALSVALPFLCMFGFILLATYFVTFLTELGFSLSAGVDLDTPGKLVLGIFVMVIVAPVVEETIFRGFLLSGLRDAFGERLSATLCGLAFALMHMNPEQTVYQFCLGYVCALAAMRARNLLAPMLIHALSNLVAVLLDTAAGKPFYKLLELLTATEARAVLSTIVLAVACGVAIHFVCKAMGALREKEDAKEQAARANTAVPATVFEEEETQAEQPQAEQPQAAQSPTPVPASGKGSRGIGTALYAAGIGLCALMWILVLVMGMIG